MICSEDEDLDRRLEEYGRHLTVSGWKYKTAKDRLVEGAKKDREKLLNQPRKRKDTKIACVSTYDPRVPSRTAIIKKNLHLLHANVVNKEIFPPRTIISADRKRKNIAQMYKSTVPQRYVQHGPMNRPPRGGGGRFEHIYHNMSAQYYWTAIVKACVRQI